MSLFSESESVIVPSVKVYILMINFVIVSFVCDIM